MSDKQIILDAADEIADLKSQIDNLRGVIRSAESVLITENSNDKFDAAGILIRPEVEL